MQCNLFAFLLRHQDHRDDHDQARRGADTRGAKSQTARCLLESRNYGMTPSPALNPQSASDDLPSGTFDASKRQKGPCPHIATIIPNVRAPSCAG
jgi:hypothetical protein